QDRNFWLGDAFASGGSAGYDHKAMGITARGAWEAVKRHFREENHDIQTTPFTVVGVGDMSGDVFGNGMLLSEQIRLKVAFDHRDIFIDPDPDPATTYAARKTLFEAGRTTWQDYDKSTISPGGGIFSRREKSIELSPEIRHMLGVEAQALSPNELIRACLKMPCDLLWMGGIGTYVSASGETDDMVGDHANDAVRVTAAEVGARAIGEGANLGVSQRGRIEFSARGGRINTDAIDNSAGVNSSDLEVNIKIALRGAIENGRLDEEARNDLLKEMTEDVAAKCLENNYAQTLAISLGERRALADLGFQERLMRRLEQRGLLDREVELLPGTSAIQERRAAGEALTRPELAVLLAYAKIALFDDIVASDLPDDAHFAGLLTGYFPAAMQERFADDIAGHRLRREIIATGIANGVVNMGGSTIISRLVDETDAAVADVVRAGILARDVFELGSLWERVHGFDNQMDGLAQLGLYKALQDELRRQTAAFLRLAVSQGSIAERIERYRPTVQNYLDMRANGGGTAGDNSAASGLAEGDGAPKGLSQLRREIERLASATRALDFAACVVEEGADPAHLGSAFEAVGEDLAVERIRAAANAMSIVDAYDRLAINGALADVSSAHRSIALALQPTANGAAPAHEIHPSSTGSQVAALPGLSDELRAFVVPRIERLQTRVAELADGSGLTVARLAVVSSQMGDLARQVKGLTQAPPQARAPAPYSLPLNTTGATH
ncbi:MAG: NAD-glutamate dehydrogenase domain-containing protein, partial [Pseudomonadota bacterium]